MTTNPFGVDPVQLFGDYMKVTGVPTLSIEADPRACVGAGPCACPPEGQPQGVAPTGKKLGVVNGSSWVSLWSTYFGRLMLPGVKIVNVGNEAVQLNFMDAHEHHRPCPPQINIGLFCRYARDLFDLVKVDAILISCSTMNRAFAQVRAHMQEVGVPVVQIDEAMMEEAVNIGGRILVVATHGPTVKSTQSLLQETADRLGKSVAFEGITTEAAFDLLGQGRIREHNGLIDRAIRLVQRERTVDVVVLAQLSMSIFSFYHPDPVAVYGIPVLNSGQTGFRRAGEILAGARPQ